MSETHHFDNFIIQTTADTDGTAVRDLKLNMQKLFLSESLSEFEKSLLFIAVGKTLNFKKLQILGEELAKQTQIQQEIINEAKQIPAIMGMLNTYYKFRFFVENNNKNSQLEYGAPNLRMNSLAKPLMGKSTFELISLAISLLNSCEKCVIAHEKSLLALGTPFTKINDAIRITSVAKGMSVL